MPISNLCSKKLICVKQETTIKQAAQLMKDNQVGAVVVIDSNSGEKPVGILTDRDIAIASVADGFTPLAWVNNVMSRNVGTIREDDGVAETISQMNSLGVRRLVVVDKFGAATGVISADDLLQLIGSEMGELSGLVQKQLKNTPEKREKSYLRSIEEPNWEEWAEWSQWGE